MKLVSALLVLALVLALLPAAAHADEKKDALRSEVQAAAQAEKTDALRREYEAAPAGSDAQKRAGQKICFHLVGPLAVAAWTNSGKLLCENLKR